MGRMHKSTAINQLMLEIEGWYGEGGGRRVQDGEHMRNKGIKKKKQTKAVITYTLDVQGDGRWQFRS